MPTMRLSEAIRLGGLTHPQHFGGAYATDDSGQVVATCAVAGAVVALGGRVEHFPKGVFFVEQCGNYVGDFALCPATASLRGEQTACLRQDTVLATCVHLNDFHRWTREQIADWVATQERSRELPQTAPTAELVTA